TVAWAMMGAFLYANFLVERIGRREIERIVAFSPIESERRLTGKRIEKLRGALAELTKMSPEFLLDTSRIFLTMLGHPRDIRRVLAKDPFDLAERDPELPSRAASLVRILAD